MMRTPASRAPRSSTWHQPVTARSSTCGPGAAGMSSQLTRGALMAEHVPQAAQPRPGLAGGAGNHRRAPPGTCGREVTFRAGYCEAS